MISHMKRVVICAAVGFLGAGCSASGPPFEKIAIPEGKSVIYAYRPQSLLGAAVQPLVTCGGQGKALQPGGYSAMVVEPGIIRCSATTESTSEVNVEAAPGAENYVQETIGVGILVGRPHLLLMDPATGESEARSCRQQP